MNDDLFLGIDTSAYTTSLAVVNQNCKVLVDLRRKLCVKKGNRGLRQQEAVFQHINNLPELMDILSNEIDVKMIKVVSASVSPRNVKDSYMPVFRTSDMLGRILSSALNVPYYEFSHQEGHIASGYVNGNLPKNKNFISMHISGGTTEILHVINKDNRYVTEIIGGTKDISAGQLIDRIGVRLGQTFPCGKQMDILSQKGNLIKISLQTKLKGSWINFSGAENYFCNLIESNKYSNSDISKSLFYYIGNVLKNSLVNAANQVNVNEIQIVGGVSANSIIREIIVYYNNEKNILKYYLPDVSYCTDNAVGISYLGYLKYLDMI